MDLTRPIAFPANPGASATAVVFDNGPKDATGAAGPISPGAIDKGAHLMQRVVVAVFTNVSDAVFKVEWYGYGSTNARPVVTAVAIPASLYFQRDVRIQPGRTKISITTVTAPGTWEGAAELVPDSSLSQ